ncbi:MAG: TspO/MBR family protein [Candidatus Gracilibacteria bacterium]
MDTYTYYSDLIKPFFAPPSWIFGPVWTILYIIIAVSFGFTIIQIYKKKYPLVLLAPLLINIISNLIYSPIQFGLRNNLLASIDIIIVLGSLVWFILLIKKHSKYIALAQIPYLLWVSFATLLQLSITYLNWQ